MNKLERWIIIAMVLLSVLAMAAPTTSVEACCGDPPGVGTPGFWKNHPEAWPDESAWPYDHIKVGGVFYTQEEAIAVMNTPGKGDKTYTMFNALIAAYLNKLVYNRHDCIYFELGAAEDWLSHHPVGSNVRGNSQLWQGGHGEIVYLTLDAYNNGYLCAPPRDS